MKVTAEINQEIDNKQKIRKINGTKNCISNKPWFLSVE